ncbi:hypothetical protein F4820DRAFT_453211 [Hypoxylon rubiginosum]|uniref:Uncharacterized protein n=1 Tax=Hypoxylon rubiginosum TaxID=110542 RepID=A0ACB9YLB2_9PEZI|nr:hypothetical protein F4820DRAFT_453211 [Hypoxylon rubiginosum]
MAELPTQKIVVPRYGERRIAQSSMPDIQAWIVDAKSEKGIPFKLWMKPEAYQELSGLYPELPDAEDIIRRGGFLHGRPMVDIGIELETCGGPSRPTKLYRVIHADQPFGGIKARGCGMIRIDPLHFQILVQKHLNWSCRNPSPFISVTDNLQKVKIVAAVYEARGFSGIEIIEFDTASPAWNNEEHRLWNVRDLVEKFGATVLKRRDYLEQEFLVEYSIPPGSITRRFSWKSVRNELDPDGFSRRRMKAIVRNRNTESRKRAHEEESNDENDIAETSEAEAGKEVVVKKQRGSKRATEFKLRV